MIDSVRGRAVPLVLIAVAFAVRLVAGEVVLSNGRAFLPDSGLYWGYAESLAKDGVYQVGGAGARRTPGYPLFIVGCTKLLGDANPLVPPPPSQLRAVLIAQALLGALVVGMVWSLAQSMFAGDSLLRHAAIWAGLVAAFDPFSISLGAMVLSETLFTAAFVASDLVRDEIAGRRAQTFDSLGDRRGNRRGLCGSRSPKRTAAGADWSDRDRIGVGASAMSSFPSRRSPSSCRLGSFATPTFTTLSFRRRSTSARAFTTGGIPKPTAAATWRSSIAASWRTAPHKPPPMKSPKTLSGSAKRSIGRKIIPAAFWNWRQGNSAVLVALAERRGVPIQGSSSSAAGFSR